MDRLKKIIVTGASGFIGRHIVEALSHRDDISIIALARRPVNFFDSLPNVHYSSVDLSKASLPLCCDICIHCAGLADDRSSMDDLKTHNIVSTQMLLSALTGVKHFIYISSASVYDFGIPGVKTEDCINAEDIRSDYGDSKLLAEQIIINSDIPIITILRPRAVYGQHDNTLMPRILNLVKARFYFGIGSMDNIISLTNINNISMAIKKLIDFELHQINIYNISDDRQYKLSQILKKLAIKKSGRTNLFKITIPLAAIRAFIFLFPSNKFITLQSYKYLTQNAILDNSKIKRDLNLDFKEGFDEFIE